MTDFVERATLLVDDRSTANIRKINSELSKLAATARRLQTAFAGARFGATGLAAASREAQKLNVAMSALSRQRGFSPRINTSSIAAATVAALRLKSVLAGMPTVKAGASAPRAPALPRVAAPLAPALPREIADLRRYRGLVGQIRTESIAAQRAVRAEAATTSRAARAAAAAERAETARSRAALSSYLAHQRNTSPVLARLRAEEAATRLSMRRREREAARVLSDMASPDAARRGGRAGALDSPATVGQTIGHAFASAARAAAQSIGYAIGRATMAATRDGFVKGEVADFRMRLQKLTADQRQEAERAADSIARQIGTISRPEALGLIAETLPMVNGSVASAKDLATVAADIAKVQQGLGATTRDANDKAINFLKAADQTGILTDAKGQIDVAAVREYADGFMKAVVQSGREIDPTSWLTATKNLGTAKYALNEAGRLSVAAAVEEMQAPRAGVGFNQMIKQLQGFGTTKQVLNNLEKLGLVTTKMEESGLTAKGIPKYTKATAGSTYGDMVKEDPMRFVREAIIPRMKEFGLDPTKKADAEAMARKLTSDRTATNMLVSAIVKAEEYRKYVEQAQARGTTVAEAADAANKSALIAFRKMQSQFEGLTGTFMAAFGPGFSTVLNPLADYMNRIGEWIGNGGKPDAGRALTAGALGVGGGILAMAAGKKVIDAFNPLNASAVALNGSAAALTGAARALTASAAGKALPGALGGGKAGVPMAAGGGIVAAGGGKAGWGRAALGGAGVGLALGAVDMILSDDKARAAGATFGGVAGAAIGAFAGPFGSVAGGMLGSAAGGLIVDAMRATGAADVIAGWFGDAAPKTGDAETDRLKGFLDRLSKDVAAEQKAGDAARAKGDAAAVAASDARLSALVSRVDGVVAALEAREAAILKAQPNTPPKLNARAAERLAEVVSKLPKVNVRMAEQSAGVGDRQANVEAKNAALTAELKRLRAKGAGAEEVAATVKRLATKPEDATTGGGFGGRDAVTTLGAIVSAGSSSIATAFSTGADMLGMKGPDFGNAAGSSILAVAGAFGATVASAITAAAANINVNVNQTTTGQAPAPANTGKMLPK